MISSRFLLLLVSSLVLLASPLPSRASSLSSGEHYTWRVFANTRPAPLFYQAGGIATGFSGNIFIADRGDHRLEKFSPSGALLASWGTDVEGPLHLDGPRAVAVDGDGNVYLADNGVVKLSFTGRFLARWTGGVLSYPRGLAVDSQRNIYVLSLHPVPHSPMFDRITITKLSRTGERLGSFVYRYDSQAAEGTLGAAIATTSSGNLLLSIKAERHCHSCDGTYYLLRTISPTGQTLAETPENAGGQSIAVAGDGTIFLSQPNSIEKLSPTGVLAASFGTAGCGPVQFGGDLQIAVSTLGQVFVADSQIAAIRPDHIPVPFRDGIIHRFELSGTPDGLIGSCPAAGATTLFGQINDLAVTPDSTLYLADGITSKIYRIISNGLVAGGFDASHPSWVATDRKSNVYVPSPQYVTIAKYGPNGTLLAKGDGNLIEALAVARNDDIYALTVFGEVMVLPPIGTGSRVLRRWFLRGYGPRGAGLDPQGICLDGQGNVWVADIRHNNIQKYSPSGRLLLIWGRGGTGPGRFHTPSGLTVDGRGHLFVLDTNNNRVQEFDLRGRFLASFGREGQAPGQLSSPWGIGADRSGNIYVGDRGNDRIQELAVAPT